MLYVFLICNKILKFSAKIQKVDFGHFTLHNNHDENCNATSHSLHDCSVQMKVIMNEKKEK